MLMLLSITVIMSGCASLQMLNPFANKVSFVEPPKVKTLASFDEVMIDNSQSTELSKLLRKQLKKSSAGGEPYFSKVGAFQEGKSNESIAVIMPIIKNRQSNDTSSIEERFVCPGKKMVRTCSSDKARYYNVKCVMRTARMEAGLKISANGNLIDEHFSSAETSEKLCSDVQGSLPTNENMYSKLEKQLSGKLLTNLLPQHKERLSSLIDEIEILGDKEVTMLNSAVSNAVDGNLLLAKKSYIEMIQRYPNVDELNFNLAFIEHALGNYAEAEKYYSLVASNESIDLEELTQLKAEVNSWLASGVKQVRKER